MTKDEIRERLVELLAEQCRYKKMKCVGCDPEGKYYYPKCKTEQFGEVADNLIAHGVTFAEDTNVHTKWVPVSDRLPEKERDVLMYFDTGNMAVGFWHDADEYTTFWCAWIDDGWHTDCGVEPLYWLPLPEPPKEVDNA